MDTLSLYYFSELAKDLHITRTANRLFISQQTLSNHIMRLEEYYGVKLLNRKPSLSLTYAGEYVLSFAETMNRENANLMDILADIQKQKRGLILFGASTLRMSASLPDILPEFSSQYRGKTPDVRPDLPLCCRYAASEILWRRDRGFETKGPKHGGCKRFLQAAFLYSQ